MSKTWRFKSVSVTLCSTLTRSFQNNLSALTDFSTPAILKTGYVSLTGLKYACSSFILSFGNGVKLYVLGITNVVSFSFI